MPLSAQRAWVVTREGGVRLLSVEGREPAREGLERHGPEGRRAPRPGTTQGGWLLSDGRTRLHRLTWDATAGLTLTEVLEGVELGDVLPIPGTGRYWIAGIPRGAVYGPGSEVRRVAVGFAGGARLERGADGQTHAEGHFEAGAPLEALELDWPGLARAAEAGRSLRLELRAEDTKALVGQGVRRLDDPAGLLFQWTVPPGNAEHLYQLGVSQEVENGTRLEATFEHVPFGVPMLERVWVRTALACGGVTLLLLLPMLLLGPRPCRAGGCRSSATRSTVLGVSGGGLLGLLGGLAHPRAHGAGGGGRRAGAVRGAGAACLRPCSAGSSTRTRSPGPPRRCCAGPPSGAASSPGTCGRCSAA